MKIDDALLNKLETLSALKIQDNKKDEFKSQLSEILNFVEILDEIDLKNLDVVTSVANGKTPLRDDKVINSNNDIKDIILSNSPDAQDDYFKVPKIIEN